jgi:hypothetical protein
MNTAQNGKGDKPRPMDGERFRSGWDAIFRGKDVEKSYESFDETLSREKKEHHPDDDATRSRSIFHPGE